MVNSSGLERVPENISDAEIIGSLTKVQRKNLLDVYSQYLRKGIKYGNGLRQLGCGLKTGNALWRKRLVELSAYQLTAWSMWEITDKGIHIAELLSEKNDEGVI